MNRFLSVSTLAALILMAFGQVRVPGPGGESLSVAATPVFVNDTSWSSITSSFSVSTLVAGTTSCAASFQNCIPLGDGTLSGNLEILAGTFHNSTTLTPTATDAAGQGGTTKNTYTCTTGSTSEGSVWPVLCYTLNATSGATTGIMKFGSTTVSSVVGRSAQFYNIATSSALDGSIGSCGNGSAVTSIGCASVSPTVTNDLVWAMFCPISAPAITSFTPGGSFTAEPADEQTGCEVEWEVDSGTGSITPTATYGSASTYIEIVGAFKSATAGTAPSGFYLARMLTYGEAGPVTLGNFTMKFPYGSGDLLVATHSCNTITVSGITDGTSTWTTNSNYAGGGNNTNESYVLGTGAASTGGAITIDTSGSGDCTEKLYDYVNPPSGMTVGRTHINENGGTFSSGSESWFLGGGGTVGSPDPTGQGVGLAGMPTSGVVLLNGGVVTNTYITLTSPTGALFTGSVQAGMSDTLPWTLDQDNPFGYFYLASSPTQPITFGLTSTSQSTGDISGDVFSVFGGSAVGLVNGGFQSSTTAASFVQVTSAQDAKLSDIAAGDLLMVASAVYNATARTTTKVCINGNSTCSAGTALIECSLTSNNTSCAGAGNSSVPGSSIWEITVPVGGVSQIDEVFSGNLTNGEMQWFAWRKANGGSWTADGNGAADSAIANSGTTATTHAFTTTGTPSVCASFFTGSNGYNVTPVPASEQFVMGGTQFPNTLDVSLAGIFSSTGSVAAKVSQSGAQTQTDSILCAK